MLVTLRGFFFSKWLACMVKKKEKVFDPLGASLESEQDQGRSPWLLL